MMQRISKIMAQRGMCSRREAEKFIDQRQVKVNGKLVEQQGEQAPLDAHIELLSHAKKTQKEKVTILLNKPLGYVSNLPEKGYKAAIELIEKDNEFEPDKNKPFSPFHRKKLAVCGRLDINSKGLMVLSQDGTVVKKLIGPDSRIEKEYLVYVEGDVSDAVLSRLRFGLVLDDKPLKKAKVTKLTSSLLKIILQEGKKRQIRRMCELVGLKVTGLKRVRIGKIMLGNLPEGMWRYLKSSESF
ncbi:MAG TPA: pseudouridine synthase [Chlamydiales bacterium]|nr:pseudouridine synthase [Chlamydiales bacterium]